MSKYLSMITRRIKKIGNTNLSLLTYSNVINPLNPLDVTRTSTTDNMRSYKGRYKENQIDGTNIMSNDIKLYVDPSTLDTTPTTEDRVTDGSVVYNIQKIETWVDVDTVALYVFQLRA